MPVLVVKSFPGPKTALLWSMMRMASPLFAGTLVLAFPLGLLAGREASGHSLHPIHNLSIHVPFYLPLVLFIVTTQVVTRFPGSNLFWTLPSRTSRIVQIETLVLGGGFASLGITYALGFSTTAPPSAPVPLEPALLLGTVGLVTQAWGWLLRNEDLRKTRITGWFLFCALFSASAVFLELHETGSLGLTPILLGCMLAGALSYAVSLRLAARARHGAPAEGNAADYGTEQRQTESEQHRRPPFISHNHAQAWFEVRFLWRSAMRNPAFWGGGPCMFLFIPLVAYEFSPGSSVLYYIMFGAGILALSPRIDLYRDSLEWQLPASDWRQSAAYLRVAATGMTAGTLILAVLLGLLRQLDGSTSAGDTFYSPGALLLAVWTGWVSISLGVPVLVGLVAAFVLFKPTQHNEVVVLCIFACYAGLAISALYTQAMRNRFEIRANAPSLAALAAACAVSAGLFSLEESPWPTWTLREIAGGAAVLALTRHNVRIGLIPEDAARTLQWALGAGVFLSCALSVSIGPLPLHHKGLTAILLAFGLVPAIFLPLLTTPQWVTWMRFGADAVKDTRWRMRWLS